MSSMRKRMEYIGSELGTELDTVEGWGADGAFYRAGRTEERMGGRQSAVAQWSSIKTISYE
jgi:hypothetical protein